ncbi:MAG: YeeE/YedE family protein [Erysipelotrichaceae bacterium]|nr:YeeE/YedE family protein [Erysipelotrichaceae bacterium]
MSKNSTVKKEELLKKQQEEMQQRKKRIQRPIAFILLLIAALFWFRTYSQNKLSAINMLIGFAFGAVMARSNFTFTANLRNPVMKNSYKFTYLHFKMTVITCIGINAIIALKSMMGTFDWAAYAKEPTPVSVWFFMSAVVFGFGVGILGSAGSGIIKKAANAKLDFILAMICFIIGSLFGVILRTGVTGAFGERQYYMPELFGWPMAIMIQFYLFVIYFYFVYHGAKQFGTYEMRDTVTVLEIARRKIPLGQKIHRIAHEIFVSGIEANMGIIYISIIAIVYFFFNSQVLGTGMPLATFGYKVMHLLGVDTTSLLGTSLAAQIEREVYDLPKVVMVAGYALGAAFVPLLRGDYKPAGLGDRNNIIRMVVGGFLTGVGVQGMYGANIGEVYGAISMLSLSGWLVIPFIVAGLFLAKPIHAYLGGETRPFRWGGE